VLTCDATKRDLPYGTQVAGANYWTVPINFAKTGKLLSYMGNLQNYTGTITLSRAGAADINIPIQGSGAAVALTGVNVTAGDYIVKVQITGDPGLSMGWIRNKTASTCGPVKTPGVPLDSNNKPTGLCGEDINISPVVTMASSNSDMTGITAAGGSASIQCWADAFQNDASQDYDFNDFSLVFGYEKAVVCVPSGVVTCTPNCPTACGTAASTISTCTDSCGKPTTKSCPATSACYVAPMCIASGVFELKSGQWTPVTNPATLLAGTVIRFGAAADLSSATKARFKINNGAWVVSTTKMTASNGKSYFYVEHTLISGSYEVSSEIQ